MGRRWRDPELPLPLRKVVKHLDWRYTSKQWRKTGPWVVIFEREEWKTPTLEQVAEYEKNEKIVTAHGGLMKLELRHVNGRNPYFDEADLKAMIAATAKAYPRYRTMKTWNGPGCYACTVLIDKKKRK